MHSFHRPSGRSALAVVFTLVLAVGLTASAVAEDTAAAREHYQRGTAFYDLGKYQEAIREFEAAYQAKNDPALLYNLAQSHRLAGNSEQALHFYRTYLRRVPKAPNRAEIEGRISSLEKLQEQKSATQIAPPNHSIPPPAPQPGEAPTGPPPAPVTAPPVATTPAPPTPSAGSSTSVEVVTPPTLQPPGFDPTATATVTSTPAPPPAPDPGRKLKFAGLAVGGVGVAFLVAATVFGLVAVSAADEVNRTAMERGSFDPDVEKRGTDAERIERVSLVLGVLALGGGATLYYFGRRSSERAAGSQVSLLPRLTPHQAGGVVQVRF
jgi:tetratricopeptide (TPR) repeat protein